MFDFFCLLLFWAEVILGLNSGPQFDRQAVYHLSHSTALFALVIFEVGSCLCLAWTTILLFVLPWEGGMTIIHHRTYILIEMGFWELCAWADLEPPSSPSLPPKRRGLQSWDTGTSVSFSWWFWRNSRVSLSVSCDVPLAHSVP
jgi:hypothetical protein